MFLALLAARVLAKDYAFCFYKSSDKGCPSGSEGVKLASFGDWNSKPITDGEVFTFYVMDDMVDSRGKRLVFDFGHLRRADNAMITVSISATGDQRQCTIDQSPGVYTEIVGSLKLDNLEMYTATKEPDFTFTNLVLRGVTFVDVAEYSVNVTNEIDSCPSCLASFASFTARSLVVRASGSWGAANPRRRFDTSVLENVTVVNDGTHLLVQMIGDRVRVADADAPEDSSLTLDLKGVDIAKTKMGLVVSGDGGKATISCLAFGISCRLPVIDVVMKDNSELAMERSNFPPLTYSLVRVSADRAANVTVTLPAGPVPLEVDAANEGDDGKVKLVLNSEESHLAGPVHVKGNCLSIETQGEYEAKVLDIDSVYLESEVVNVSAEDKTLTIRIGKLMYGSGVQQSFFKSDYGATYTFGAYPISEKFSAKVSKLLWNATELGFSLDNAAKINATEFSIPEWSKLQLVWTGPPTVTDEDLDAHQGHILRFMCGNGLSNNMYFRLPRDGPIGMTSTTSLFRDPTWNKTENCVDMQLKGDAKIRQRATKFCFAKDQTACPDGYVWAKNVDNWQKYVTNYIDLVTFRVIDWPEDDIFNFSGFGPFDLVVEGGEVHMHAKELTWKLRSLTAIDSVIYIDTSANPAIINTTIVLRNSRIETPFSCDANYTVFDLDEASMESINKYSDKCRNVKVQLKNWNDITKVQAKADGFTLTSATAQTYEVDFNDVTFTSESDNIEFAPTQGQKLNGKFTFTMTKGGHTITMDDGFPDDYYGLYGYAINGTLVNKGRKVLMDIIGNKDVHFRSENTETVEIVYPWCVNTRLHLDEIGGKGKVALFDEGYFGTKSNITVGDDVTFAVYNGYFNSDGKIPVPVEKMQLLNQLLIYPNADYRVKNFSVGEPGKAKVVIQYVMTQLPLVVLNASTVAPVELKELEFAYQDGLVQYDEGDVILNNRKYYEQLEYDIFCGTNLNCDALHLTLTSNSTNFSGEKSLVELACREVDAESHYTCVALKVVKKGTIFWYVVGFSYLGITLCIFIGDALYFIFSPRNPYDDDPARTTSAAPLVSEPVDEEAQ